MHRQPNVWIRDQREQLVSYFTDRVNYWSEIYDKNGVCDLIYQDRLRILLKLVDALALPKGTRALDVGCGAGYTAVALAGRGYNVEAVDLAEAMVDQTRDHAMKAGLKHRIKCSTGDVHELRFPDSSFGLVVAMGVLPWLPSVEEPLREMSRVLEPGGYLIVSVDSRWGLSRLFDPLTNPLLQPAKDTARRVLGRRLNQREPTARRYSVGECDVWLDASGLEKLDCVTLGFGPFTLFGRGILPRSVGVAVHRALQELSERRLPVLRAAGSQYVVLGRKQA